VIAGIPVAQRHLDTCRGQPGDVRNGITDVSFLLCFNAHDSDLAFRTPPEEYAKTWEVVLDTGLALQPANPQVTVEAGASVSALSRSLVVLRARH
jgi:glycogen operon protein